MRKRDSKRRWKARCRLGREIPMYIIMIWELDRWFKFGSGNPLIEAYKAIL